jgi:hypothetical protein
VAVWIQTTGISRVAAIVSLSLEANPLFWILSGKRYKSL